MVPEVWEHQCFLHVSTTDHKGHLSYQGTVLLCPCPVSSFDVNLSGLGLLCQHCSVP